MLFCGLIFLGNVRKNGTLEILQYLTSLGGAPLLNSSWDEEDFDIEELFENEFHSVGLFLLQRVDRCPHPLDNSKSIVCLKSIFPLLFTEKESEKLYYMFKVLELDISLLESAVEMYLFYASVSVRLILKI